MGVSALVGSVLLMVMIPVQKVIVTKFKTLMKAYLEETDKRVKLVNMGLNLRG
jgi:hypothetical protein